MIWFQQEFPWLGPGFIHAVAEDAADAFVTRLRDLDFTVARLHTPPDVNFATALNDALGIAERAAYLSWDALHDNFRDLTLPRRFALVWRQADEFARRETKVFGEACVMLNHEFEEVGKGGTQAVLILTGSGSRFGSPDRPVGRWSDTAP